MKKRKLVLTEDGSTSIYVPELGEHYHSHFGAIQESQHIFIESALDQVDSDEISVLEFGFGTGLNALLAYQYAQVNDKKLLYCGLEKYPLAEVEYQQLNYGKADSSSILQTMHRQEWGKEFSLDGFFNLTKHALDFREFEAIPNTFHVVFYDAFAPDVQSHLWTVDIFKKVYASMKQGGVLTTYTVKGVVRRALKEVGFHVEKISGPPGKREITRAWKKAVSTAE